MYKITRIYNTKGGMHQLVVPERDFNTAFLISDRT